MRDLLLDVKHKSATSQVPDVTVRPRYVVVMNEETVEIAFGRAKTVPIIDVAQADRAPDVELVFCTENRTYYRPETTGRSR